MPVRNEVPSLQMLTLRRVAWPDGVQKKETEAYPSAEQYCRDTIYTNYVKDNVERFRKWIGQEKLKSLVNTAVNTWIQLSNYYECTLTDFKHSTVFLKLHPSHTLDFLHEGFSCSDEFDKDMFLRFVLVIPFRSKHQPVDSTSWATIVQVLTANEIISDIKELQILFKTRGRNREQAEAAYKFGTTLDGFNNLTKLVVRGPSARNELIQAIGEHCYRLKYLDISGSVATSDGILLLFFKDQKSETKYRERFKAAMTWDMPKYLLRPLTKTLEYFDMSERPRTEPQLRSSIIMACPQMIATPNKFFFAPKGQSRVICKYFDTNPTLLPLRQSLVLNVRSKFCEDIFWFVRGILACTHATNTSFEVRIDEVGHEIGFLFYSNDCLIAYCELENLTVINFSSYTKSSCQFIPIDLLGQFAPKLERIKAPLKGMVGDKYPLLSLKHVATQMVHDMRVIKSIVQKCPALSYLEVYELLYHPRHMDDEDFSEIFEGHYCENLSVFRILFKNRISLLGGFTELLKSCPSLRMIGDLGRWNVSEKSVFRLQKQVNFHNFRIIIEYNGILYNSNNFGSSCLDIVV